MSRTDHIRLMAKYNEWMNCRLYAAAMSLPDEELVRNRRAFFGSVLGTLNHLVVGDTIWLKRFATHPANYSALEAVRNLPTPASLDQLLHTDVRDLSKYRTSLDQIITEWTRTITEHDLDHVLHYANTRGVAADKRFFSLVMHFFNHQTHHRGQATTLLSQAGVDVGVTDLLAIIANETPA
ncbi:DinB family protein [Accumulibacter sp.]|uniref:DinB family protein n=1 Tax=Accumulibacter sp. TaxID=2053492 RepID=UPI0028C50A37|nr:DinB family protein [Accumulibacter sp.]